VSRSTSLASLTRGFRVWLLVLLRVCIAEQRDGQHWLPPPAQDIAIRLYVVSLVKTLLILFLITINLFIIALLYYRSVAGASMNSMVAACVAGLGVNWCPRDGARVGALRRLTCHSKAPP